MKRVLSRLACAVLCSGLAWPAQAQDKRDDDVLKRALADELSRTMGSLLIRGEARPYYAAYTVTDTEATVVGATLGSVTLDTRQPHRQLFAALRVGSPQLDNSNAGLESVNGDLFGSAPREDDYLALRRKLWLMTDQEYKGALEALALKKNALATRMKERAETYPDFSAEPQHETVRPVVRVDWGAEQRKLRALAVRLSSVFNAATHVQDSSVFVTATSTRRRLLTSEGTWADESQVRSSVQINATTQADDGMPLVWDLGFHGTLPSTLPSSEFMEAEVKAAAAKLEELRHAPLAENGTAIILFEGMAAAQLVQVLLAPRLSGAPPWRLAHIDTDRSLASKLGMLVTSPLLDVYDDPTQALGPRGEPLWGSYAADDEGVPARKVSLIERGILRTLLMSRAPRKEIRQSNGHRRGSGPEIGNLIVKANRPRSRRELIALALRQGRAGAGRPPRPVYVVRRLGSRPGALQMPSFAAMHMPLRAGAGLLASEAYLLEGGKEKLVRGLVLDQLDIKLFKDLLGVGSDAYVLNHMASGEHAAIVAPGLLVADVDVRKHEAENPKLPSYAQP